MKLEVKICGVRTPEAIAAAVAGGARHVGLVFYPPSPRAVDPALAAELARQVPTGVRAVGLFVDPDDALLDRIVASVPLDMVQLHGEESPARVAAIRAAYGIPVMKAIRVAEAADLDRVPAYAAVADRLLFDAKPPRGVTALPGGNGLPFDWRILAGRSWPAASSQLGSSLSGLSQSGSGQPETERPADRPWMLSGGLTAGNLAAAVAATGARAVDVSSGVEDRPGHKVPALIAAFLAAAASLDAARSS